MIDVVVLANQIYRYFFPPRKLHRIPRIISAKYDRAGVTKEQAILMMAALARDPEQAQQVYEDLKAKHGSDVWDYVRFEVRRKRGITFRERFMRLLRRMAGEEESPNLRWRREEPIVFVRHRLPDD